MTPEGKLEQVREAVQRSCEGFLGQKISGEYDLKCISSEIRRVILPFWPECPELFCVQLSLNDIGITDKYGKPLDYLLVEALMGWEV